MSGRIRFGVYELDRDTMELRKHGVPIRLQEQPFQVLTALLEKPGEIVTRDELQKRIWGTDTFVDFEQSLNKAVNRLREALNDDPAQPRYVETVPRRGYRFIAPVTGISGAEAPGATGSVGPALVPGPEKGPSDRRRRIIILTSLTAAVLISLGVWTVLSLKRPTKPTIREARHMTTGGFAPALSRDGRMLAYVSTASTDPPHLWVQQTAGGEPTRVTPGSELDVEPDFSPDTTQIVFYSGRKGGGIYLAPTLSGEARLVVQAPDAADPRFSPRGDSILYWKDQAAFVVSVEGGEPAPLALNQDFRVDCPAFWSPGGEEILFYGVRKDNPNKPGEWWIAAVAAGKARSAHLPGAEQNYEPGAAVRAWVRTIDGREWIIYSVTSVDSWKLLRIGISSQGAIDENPELISAGTGRLGGGGGASADGRVAFDTWRSSEAIYQISTDDHGLKVGPNIQLPLPEGGTHRSPSLSRDGRWMAYDSSNAGRPDTVLVRDLNDGTDHFVDDKGRDPFRGGDASISPDGSVVVFQRDCEHGTWPGDPELPFPCSFVVPVGGGQPELVCEHCAPRGFSSDGSVILCQKYHETDPYKAWIVAVDLRTRTEREFLRHAAKPLFHAYFSWDDRWVVFKKLQSLDSEPWLAQILIAPVRHGQAAKEGEWIAVTDGHYSDDTPQFSPDGNTVYFTSTRDGYLCIWAQRLDPATKHPVGAPFPYEHFHNSAGRTVAIFRTELSNLSVARGKILINLPQRDSDIWMTQIE